MHGGRDAARQGVEGVRVPPRSGQALWHAGSVRHGTPALVLYYFAPHFVETHTSVKYTLLRIKFATLPY